MPLVLLVVAIQRRVLLSRVALYPLLLTAAIVSSYLIARFCFLGNLIGGSANTNITWTRALGAIGDAGRLVFYSGQRYVGECVVLLAVVLALVFIARERRGARDLVCVLAMSLISMVPALGLVMRWYLYIPSAFACMLVARVWHEPVRIPVLGKVLPLLFLLLLFLFGYTLSREGRHWRDAGHLSTHILQTVTSTILDSVPTATGGRLFLINVPSAYFPPGSVGEKPIFAYHLGRAVGIPSPRRAGVELIVVNHVMLRALRSGASTIERIDDGRFLVRCSERCLFSFHSQEFISGRRRQSATTLYHGWGQVRIVNPRQLLIRINARSGDPIWFFDGGRWRRQ